MMLIKYVFDILCASLCVLTVMNVTKYIYSRTVLRYKFELLCFFKKFFFSIFIPFCQMLFFLLCCIHLSTSVSSYFADNRLLQSQSGTF